MASAGEQARRNADIRAAHAAGESPAALAARFGLSPSRVSQIVQTRAEVVAGDAGAMRLALARRAEYREVVDQLAVVAGALPMVQASAKIGAFRAWLDALDRLTTLERALGLLPSDLGQLSDQRQLAEAVLAVFIEFNVPDDARSALVKRLGAVEAPS